MLLSQEELRRVLHYDPQTGAWTKVKNGKRVGYIDQDSGYREISFRGKRYRSAKLAWFYVKGEWPDRIVDHKDNNKTNDVFSNFRLASKSQNAANAKLPKHSTTGLKGVCKLKRGRYMASIMHNDRNYYLGRFDCPAAAHFAYLIEADKRFGEFARAR
jgi:HNH endonuclease